MASTSLFRCSHGARTQHGQDNCRHATPTRALQSRGPARNMSTRPEGTYRHPAVADAARRPSLTVHRGQWSRVRAERRGASIVLRAASEEPEIELSAGTEISVDSAAESEAGQEGADVSGQESTVESDLEASSVSLSDLQGSWLDGVGLEIRVEDDRAIFSDGAVMPIGHFDRVLTVRGTVQVGTAERPAWRFKNGRQIEWRRPEEDDVRVPPMALDPSWRSLFHEYKQRRIAFRQALHQAVQDEDYKAAADAKRRWEQGEGLAEGATSPTMEQEAWLHSGKGIVPGVCFRHRIHEYRGVVIGCEHGCNTTRQWKEAMNVEALPRGSSQPFYHCLVHAADRGPSAQTTFVAEENIVPDTDGDCFPIEHPLQELLLEESAVLRGYLPTEKLTASLELQRDGEMFMFG